MGQDLFKHFLQLNNSSNDIPVLIQTESHVTKQTEILNNLEEHESINQELLSHLKMIIPDFKYKTYFEDNLTIIKVENDTVYFQVKTNFIKKAVESHSDEIGNSLYQIFGKKFNLNFIASETNINSEIKSKNVNDNKFTLELSPTKDDLSARIQTQYIEHMNPNKNSIIIDNQKTFKNFIVGPTNNMAQAAAAAVSQAPGKNGKYPSLYVHSNSGLGKTHLLHAIANEINLRHPLLNICLISSKNFMDELISLVQQNKFNDFVKKYTENIDVLMIDDIHELKDKKGTQDQFFHIFNELHNKGKQLVFTSDKPPKEIDGISERIKTRLQWGLVVDIQSPDLETRIAILKRKMESLDLYVTEDILTLIASKIKTNIRELEGSLVKLKAVSELMNVEIEIDLVKEQLMFNQNENDKDVTMDQISKATAQYYRIPLADLKSKSRNQEITKARHIAMYLARKIANSKQQEIGEYFGGRDHSSVIHAVNTISEKMKTDSSLSKDINSIETNL
jgi:chromosomal replication initiator protein